MPETMSIERRRVLKMLGANLELTPGDDGMYGSIARAEDMIASDPDRYILLQQFKNPANPAIHFETTGPEIWEDTAGAIDVLVAGVGTGGTISGISRYIKQKQGKKITTIAVEPARCPVITQTLARKKVTPGHTAGFIPDTLDLSVLDRVETVEDDEAIEFARRLAKEEGILCGISCGAAAAVACRVAKEPAMAGKLIVTILPDGGERYLSSTLFDGIA
jgi:cysteine synthase A